MLMQTFVSAQGTEIITKGLNEYEVRKNSLEITLLRSTDVISNPKNPARGTPAGPPIKTPDLTGLGNNEVEFALTFSDNVKACQQSFYGCVFGYFGNQKPQKFLDIKGEFIDARLDGSLKVRTLRNNKIFEV